MEVSSKVSALALTYFMAMALALLIPSHAQNSPQDYLDAHNTARAVGVESVIWDDTVTNGGSRNIFEGWARAHPIRHVNPPVTVAAYAQSYANQRIADSDLVHSGGPYGENLAWSSGDLSGVDAIAMWVNEGADYDYDSNSCAPDKVCGHYTQVVWRNSVRLGCAKVTCNNGGTFITCNYDPAGNVIRPY